LARSLRPNPIGVEHGLAILWPLIAGEERDIGNTAKVTFDL
jgi:hypothetical protein